MPPVKLQDQGSLKSKSFQGVFDTSDVSNTAPGDDATVVSGITQGTGLRTIQRGAFQANLTPDMELQQFVTTVVKLKEVIGSDTPPLMVDKFLCVYPSTSAEDAGRIARDNRPLTPTKKQHLLDYF